MDTAKPLINRVAQSALITLDLETLFPDPEVIASIDLKDFLFQGLILREAEFRESVKNTTWSDYQDKYVALYCSTNAIIPMWAYMILTAELAPFAKDIASSGPKHASEIFLYRQIERLDLNEFNEQRVVIKGCGDRKIPEAAFVHVTQKLTPVVRSLMYGEPCSTVPVFKSARLK